MFIVVFFLLAIRIIILIIFDCLFVIYCHNLTNRIENIFPKLLTCPDCPTAPPPSKRSEHTKTKQKKTLFLEQEQHYVKNDGISSTGLETDNELTTFDANQKAIEALQLLLRKLPNKLAVKENALQTTIDDDNLIPDTKLTPQHITQYQIPNDPYIPKFKPIKSSVTSTYTFQLGPIEQITQDTYGGSDHEHKHSSTNHHLAAAAPPALPPPPSAYLIQKTVASPELQRHLVPPPSIESVSITPFNSQSSSSSPHSHTIDAQPLDLYHTMTLKRVNDNHLNHPPVQSLPYLPPQKRSNPSNAPQFEIQKSIEYQLH